MDFGRLLTAMVTPFDENGQVSLERTTELVNYLIENNTEGIVVAGTTGESPTLSPDEKLVLFEHVVKAARGRAKVIVGTGSNDTLKTAEFSKRAEALGVDGIMAVAPYYNKPNQAGLYEHFKTIAESVNLPIIVYNIPGRSSVNIAAKTIIELSKIDNVAGVKEASGNLDQMAEIIRETSGDFHLYSGDDGLTLPVLAIGGQGVISVASHVIGPDMKAMIDAFLNGEHAKAARMHLAMLPLMRELFAAPSPAPVKTLLNEAGVEVGGFRLPIVPLTSEEKTSLLEVYHQYIQNK
ncbi:4-hydroxy-tetrahydrodipicolinate synthase [Terrilactibacillus sp. S3-3]|nr:4-hydroxy-tetrahydrodipicolinate synthase [Terrilactibacillus sp. S3-3]